MKTFKFEKLVRDNTTSLAKDSNGHYTYKILKGNEKKIALEKKLEEEVGELLSAKSKNELSAEIADVIEVSDSR